MSSTILFANNASSTLAGAITNTATTVNLAAGSGALFPNPGAGQFFVMTFVDAATGLLNEIVWCTARTADTLTILRAQEGTTAKSWLAGDLAASLWTAGQAAAMQQADLLQPARIVTASGAFTMSTADANGGVGLNRTVSPGVSSTTLPSGANVGDVYTIEDLAGNFNAFPVTVNYPATHTGPEGATSQILNVNKGSYSFRFYGSNQWGYRQQ
jgi:hypothetical protein